MVEDDDDYMADLSQFLPTESPAPVPQARPQRRNGNLSVNAKVKPPGREQRKITQEQHKKAEEDQRKEGLGSAIPSSNIGFKMLQQMGYTPGGALGKHGQGLLEPVNIDLKRSRTGLGRDSAAKEEELVKARRAEIEAMRNKQKEMALKAVFQERRRDSWHSRKIASDYRKACTTYLQLEESSRSSASAEDKPKDKSSPPDEAGSGPHGVATNGENEDAAAEEEEVEEITLEMLQEMLQRLRECNYCLYCGCKYDSAAALSANCPGLDDDAH